MKRSYFLWIYLLAATIFLLNVQTTAATNQIGKKGDANEVISLVNQLRAARGLAAYQANGALMAAAQAHSEYQAKIGSITHTGAGGSRPADRAIAAGYGGGLKVYVSENIYGGNNASPQQAVGWWQGDSLHLTTMISPNYVDVGVGVAVGGNTVYYTLDAGYISGSPGSQVNPPSGDGSSPKPTAPSGPTVVAIIPVQVATPAADGSIIHIVQPGQALWNIAAAYKIELADLLAINGLTKESFIHPGDKIIVRSPQSPISTDNPMVISPTIQSTGWTARPDLASGSTSATQGLVLGVDSQSTPFATQQPGATERANPGKTQAKKNEADYILLAIGGLVVVGTSLILIGSLAVRKKPDD